MIDISRLEAHLEKYPVQDNPSAAADALVRAELLTPFQARYLLQGKHKGLIFGVSKVLKPLAKGGMGFVYVAERLELSRKVALKICMIDKVGAGAVERFSVRLALSPPSMIPTWFAFMIAGAKTTRIFWSWNMSRANRSTT